MPPDQVEKQVEASSKFWHEHRAELARTKQLWRGREADYLDIARVKVANQIEAYRWVLMKRVGRDITMKSYVPLGAYDLSTPRHSSYLLNVERAVQDLLKVVEAVERTIQAARQNGKDPALEAYDMFFWAMNNIPAAGTLFLMQDSEGPLQEETNLLMAGWAEQHLSLWGQHATRLQSTLKKEGQPLRGQLHQELPAAILQAAHEWKPGLELLVGDPRKPQPGKQTAGRGPRNFRSRVARIIDCQGSPDAASFEEDTFSGRCSLNDSTQEDLMSEGSMSEDTHRMATNQEPSTRNLASSGDDAIRLRQMWSTLITKAKLTGHTLRMAEFLRDDPDWLKPSADGKIMLKRGALQTMCCAFGRPVNLLKQDRKRMALKMEAVLRSNTTARR